MDKQKQIEEMAKDLKQIKFNMQGCFIPQYVGVHEDITARDLYELGYRKIPEGAVVLTREEYEILKLNMVELERTSKSINDFDGNLIIENQVLKNKVSELETLCDEKDHVIRVYWKEKKQARKETAEKFAEKLKDKAYEANYIRKDNQIDITDYFLDIDEILKEITGE